MWMVPKNGNSTFKVLCPCDVIYRKCAILEPSSANHWTAFIDIHANNCDIKLSFHELSAAERSTFPTLPGFSIVYRNKNNSLQIRNCMEEMYKLQCLKDLSKYCLEMKIFPNNTWKELPNTTIYTFSLQFLIKIKFIFSYNEHFLRKWL